MPDVLRLLPYLPEHVPTYHAWMENEELRAATASDRLSLEEEFEMRDKWARDIDKHTFIIAVEQQEQQQQQEEDTSPGPVRLIGDVNLFIQDCELGCGIECPNPNHRKLGELEIMVAEQAYRRNGYARDALREMMTHGESKLNVCGYIAKCLTWNAKAHALFLSLGFTQVTTDLQEEMHFTFQTNPLKPFRELDLSAVFRNGLPTATQTELCAAWRQGQLTEAVKLWLKQLERAKADKSTSLQKKLALLIEEHKTAKQTGGSSKRQQRMVASLQRKLLGMDTAHQKQVEAVQEVQQALAKHLTF